MSLYDVLMFDLQAAVYAGLTLLIGLVALALLATEAILLFRALAFWNQFLTETIQARTKTKLFA